MDAANPMSSTSTSRRVSLRTRVVKNNGFNPVWQESLSIPFDCVGGPEGEMQNLIFVEFAVRQEGSDDDDDPIAVYCAPLGTVALGVSFLPIPSTSELLTWSNKDIDISHCMICSSCSICSPRYSSKPPYVMPTDELILPLLDLPFQYPT